MGGLPGRRGAAIIATVDFEKRDAEIKTLLGCTHEETQTALRFHTDGEQAAVLFERPARDQSLISNL
ncbi:MAG: hypothetical protein ACRDH2_12345 [Anaerolineales bacterium]